MKYQAKLKVLIATCFLSFLNNHMLFSQKQIENYKPLIEVFENGKINWTEQYVESTGINFINHDKFKNKKQAYEMAKLGAKLVAKANLLEIVSKVKIIRTTTVKDLFEQSDEVQSKLEGVISGCVQIGNAKSDSDQVEITLRLSLNSNSNLFDAIKEKLQNERIPTNSEITDSNSILNYHFDSITIRQTNSQMIIPVSDSKAVALNFVNGKYDPSMFPIIIDENGNLVLDIPKDFDKLKDKYSAYLNLANELFKSTNFKEGIEVVDAIQKPNGTIQILNTNNKPKLKSWLKIAKDIGSVALPILLSLI